VTRKVAYVVQILFQTKKTRFQKENPTVFIPTTPFLRNYNSKEEEDKLFTAISKSHVYEFLECKTKKEKKNHPSMSVNVVRKAAATFLWLIIVVIGRIFFFFFLTSFFTLFRRCRAAIHLLSQFTMLGSSNERKSRMI
jgi:hypothetical protein